MENNYTHDELKSLLAAVGSRVAIHKSVIFFNPKCISIASDVRIDCYSMLSAGDEGIQIGNHVHIGASAHLFGSGGKITLEDFVNISSRVSIFTVSDNYQEGYLTNPTVPSKYKKVKTGPVFFSRHSGAGCGSVIMPNVTLHLGAAVGALSLVKVSVESFQIVGGIPAVVLGKRSDQLLTLEQQFLRDKVTV